MKTMKKDHLNNSLLLHCCMSITDTLNTVDIAKTFVCPDEQRKAFWKINTSRGMRLALTMSPVPPPPPPMFETVHHLFSVVFFKRG